MKKIFTFCISALLLSSLLFTNVFAIERGEIAADGTYSYNITATKYKKGKVDKTKYSTLYVSVANGKISKIECHGGDSDKFRKYLLRDPVVSGMKGKDARLEILDSITSASLNGRPGHSKYTMNFRQAMEGALRKAPAKNDLPATPIEINNVDLAVEAPITGGSPEAATAAQNSGYSIISTNWYPTVHSTFAPETEYTVIVKLKANDGRVFANTLKAKINGKDVNVNGINENTIEASFTFPKTLPSVPQYELEVAENTLDFVAEEDYEAIESQKFTAVSKGSKEITNLKAELSGADADKFDVSCIGMQVIVTPKKGIPHGNYNAQINISDVGNNVSVQRSLTLAVKKAPTYNLVTKVEGNGGTISPSVSDCVKFSVQEITLTADRGYEVDEVTVDGMKVNPLNGKIAVLMDGDKNVVVKYKKQKFAITYKLNGGALNGNTDDVIENIEYGSTIILPKPEKENYEFEYWKGSQYQAGDSYEVTEAHIFEAIWKEKINATPEVPGGNPTQPSDDPQQPGGNPAQPSDDPQQPGNNPQQPGDNPVQPGNDIDKPEGLDNNLKPQVNSALDKLSAKNAFKTDDKAKVLKGVVNTEDMQNVFNYAILVVLSIAGAIFAAVGLKKQKSKQ